MVMQDHFSKYVVAYVVKDQMARTAAETLRRLFWLVQCTRVPCQ